MTVFLKADRFYRYPMLRLLLRDRIHRRWKNGKQVVAGEEYACFAQTDLRGELVRQRVTDLQVFQAQVSGTLQITGLCFMVLCCISVEIGLWKVSVEIGTHIITSGRK